MDMNDILNHDKRFRYMLLDRMRSDCEYYLGYGNRYPKHLWAGNEKDQIEAMKALWKSFNENEKPVFLTYEQILYYEKQMVPEKDRTPVLSDNTFKEGTRVHISGDSKDLWIEDYNVRVDSDATVLTEPQSQDKKILLSIDYIDGEGNVTAYVRKDAVKALGMNHDNNVSLDSKIQSASSRMTEIHANSHEKSKNAEQER